MDGDNTVLRMIWTILASIAGAITALSYRPFENMRPIQITLSLMVGASFAIFVGPLVAIWIFGKDVSDIRLLGALFYLLATGSNVLIPFAVRKLANLFGEEKR